MSISSPTDAFIQDLCPTPSQRGDLTWEMATMFPRQGDWTEQEYLSREFEGLVEFVDGMLEFLPMPTFPRQDLVAYLFERLTAFIGPRTPREVYFAPIRVRTRAGNVREPDVAYIQSKRIKDRMAPSEGADLVIEVVSPDERDRQRDYETKRKEYAETGIPEYWIVDPVTRVVTVLVLDEDKYVNHGEFIVGDVATSKALPGFEVDVTDLFSSLA